MAIVINPALSMAASGNVGAINYSRWRGGAIARGARTDHPVPSTAQLYYKGLLQNVCIAWGTTVTALEREMWNSYARENTKVGRLGLVYQPTGYQWFIQLNTQRAVIGLAIATKPPTADQTMAVREFHVEWLPVYSEFFIVLYGYTGIGWGDWWQLQRAGPYNGGGYTAQKNNYRLLYQHRPAGQYFDAAIITGKWYWYRARLCKDSGRVSNWLYAQRKAA